MTEEENIKKELTERFGFADEKITVKRIRRIFIDLPAEKFAEVFDYAISKMGFVILCTITGLDEGATLGFIYHLARENGIMLNLHINVPKENPVIKTITPSFPAADAYERELIDLLGAKVTGLPEGNRYPLPDDWPADQHPLRKDWKPTTPQKEEATENA